MAFTLTKYIYPIKDKITLSSFFNYYIDNPRTDEEIQFVKEYISPALKRNYENSSKGYNPMLSAVFSIGEWKEYMKNKDEYVYNYLSNSHNKSVEDIISESWVIIRYDDNGEFEKAARDKSVFFDIFFSDAKIAYWDKYNTLLSYCHLLSILSHNDNEGYIGDSIVLLRKPQDIFYPIDHTHEIIEAFSTFYNKCANANDNRFISWNFYPDVKDELLTIASLLEAIFNSKETIIKNNKQSSKNKLLFVGDLLRVIENETQDVKVKLMLLTSIIEYLITRNPDTTRFNVEDSISKQFVLKASILVYLNNKEINLDELKINLKTIYKQRSDVAHGNYISKSDDDKMINSFYLLYSYIRAILNQYIKDNKFVDYIKEN